MGLVILNLRWTTWEMAWRKFLWIQSCYSIMPIRMRDWASIILQSSFSGLHKRFERIGVLHIMEKRCLILNNKNLNWLQNVPKRQLQHLNWNLRMKTKLINCKNNIKPWNISWRCAIKTWKSLRKPKRYILLFTKTSVEKKDGFSWITSSVLSCCLYSKTDWSNTTNSKSTWVSWMNFSQCRSTLSATSSSITLTSQQATWTWRSTACSFTTCSKTRPSSIALVKKRFFNT